MNNSAYYDYIDTLPINKHSRQNEVELELIRTLFHKKNKNLVDTLFKESYEPFLVGLLFLVMSIPYSDNVIKSLFPMATNLDVIFLVIKTILIMIFYWLLKNTVF